MQPAAWAATETGSVPVSSMGHSQGPTSGDSKGWD